MKRKKSSKAYIGIGSNLGNRKANIEKALSLVKLIKGVKLEKVSSIYETDPVGGPVQGKFLNGVFEIGTNLNPFNLLLELKKIEKGLGRKRKSKNAPRMIDLDILTFGKQEIKTKELKVPHPRMHKREFVLRGIREIKRSSKVL